MSKCFSLILKLHTVPKETQNDVKEFIVLFCSVAVTVFT